jgi:hypothetical protein
MATFKEMQDRINLDYLNRTDLGNETKRAIIRAVKHYEKERFWFNMTATALAIGTASTTVAVPADFLALDFATVADSGGNPIVNIKSFDRIAYQNRTVTSGVPSEVTYFRDALYFYPKPSSATSLTITYTHALPTLSADSDTNGWTSAGEDIIVFHATCDMLANVLRVNDPTLIANFKMQETEAYKMLKFGNDMRLGMGNEVGVAGTIQHQAPKVPDKNMP